MVINFFQRSIRYNYIINFGGKNIILILREQSQYLNFSEDFSSLKTIFDYIFNQLDGDTISRLSVSGLDNFSVATIAKHFCHEVIFITCVPYIVQQNVLFSPCRYNFSPLFLLLIFHNLLLNFKKNYYNQFKDSIIIYFKIIELH